MSVDSVPPEQKAQIANAVRMVLTERGYARPMTEKVAAESDKNGAGPYYYCDSEDEMIIASLETPEDYFTRSLHDIDAEGPEARPQAVCDILLADEGDAAAAGVNIAIMKLLSHASHNETPCEPLLRIECHTLGVIVDIARDSVEQGVFREVGPEGMAAFTLSATDGYTGFALALGMENVGDDLRASLSAYIDSLLVVA